MIFSQCIIPGLNCFFQSFIGFYKDLFIVECNFYSKAFFMNIDILHSSILGIASLIHLVLSACAVSQITLAIVQGVMIYVVAEQTFRCIHDKASHVNRFSFWRRSPSNSIEGFSYWAPCCRPLESTDLFKVLVIDKCKLSLSQRYLFHGLSLANLHGLGRFAWLSGTVRTSEHTTASGNQIDGLDGNHFDVKAVFGFALELFRSAVALGEIVAKCFNIAGQLKDGVGRVGFFEVFKQSFNGGFTKGLGEFRGNGQSGKIRHGGTPFGLGDSAVCLIKFIQINSVLRHGGWFRAYRALTRSLGSLLLGLWLFLQIFITYFNALAANIFDKGKHNLTLQTSLILISQFSECFVKLFDQPKSYGYHALQFSTTLLQCQGIENAVSAATGTGQERRRMP